MTNEPPPEGRGCYGAVLLAACLWAAIATSGWVICWLTK